MRTPLAALALSLTALAPSASGAAEPSKIFGISMGTPIEQLELIDEVQTGHFIVAAQSPHPHFETYVVKHTTETGVCELRAIGKDHPRDGYGEDIRARFSELAEALEKRYGPYFLVDFIRPEAIWTEYRDWVAAIHQGERVYGAVWSGDQNSDLPQDVQNIELQVETTGHDNSYLVVRYSFSNEERCDEILSEQNNQGL